MKKEVINLKINGHSFWMTKEEHNIELKMMKESQQEAIKHTLFGKMKEFQDTVIKDFENSVKLAMVEINGKQQMVGRSNITGDFYELYEDAPAVKSPLVQINNDSIVFKRWATGFDV